jgi:hypothetical protein
MELDTDKTVQERISEWLRAERGEQGDQRKRWTKNWAEKMTVGEDLPEREKKWRERRSTGIEGEKRRKGGQVFCGN